MQHSFSHGATPRQVPPAALLMFDVEDLMATTVRLSQVMERESGYLAEMKITEILPLQPEKLELTQKLEAYQAAVRARPELVREMPETVREKLLQMMDQFGQIMADHVRRITVARQVNSKVVQAIFDSIAEQQQLPTYTREGTSGLTGSSAISFSYNQKA
jgi:hypothetical protein